MLPHAAKHFQYMKRCLEDAECLSGVERDTLLYMAQSFECGAIQIERSVRLIAESKEALALAEKVLAGIAPPPHSRRLGRTAYPNRAKALRPLTERKAAPAFAENVLVGNSASRFSTSLYGVEAAGTARVPTGTTIETMQTP